MSAAAENHDAESRAPSGTPQASSAVGASPAIRIGSRSDTCNAGVDRDGAPAVAASTPNLFEPRPGHSERGTEGVAGGSATPEITSTETILDGEGREAAGDGPCPADPCPLPSGLVGIQTSDTSELTEIAFVARDLREASRALALSSRLRKMKLVVGHHADTVRDLFAQAGIAVDCIMVTLTYAPGVAYSPRQITSYVRRMCGWLDTRSITFAFEWVLELQQRGAPHYHVIWWVPAGTRLPMPDCARGRQRKPLWPFGMSRIEIARSGPAYIMKYASKGTNGGGLPKGARLYGVGGFDTAKRIAQWRALPAYIRDKTTEGEVVRRAKGGGWVVRESGEHIPPAWTRHVVWGPSYCRVVLKRISSS